MVFGESILDIVVAVCFLDNLCTVLVLTERYTQQNSLVRSIHIEISENEASKRTNEMSNSNNKIEFKLCVSALAHNKHM